MKHLAGYYVVKDFKNGNRILYGPFQLQKDAEQANYFRKSVTERDRAVTSHDHDGAIRVLFAAGVNYYGPDDLTTIAANPEEYGFEKVTIRSAKSSPLHSTWRELAEKDVAFPMHLFEKDYEQYVGNAKRR